MKGYKYKNKRYESKPQAENIKLPTEKDLMIGMSEAFMMVSAIEIKEKERRRSENSERNNW